MQKHQTNRHIPGTALERATSRGIDWVAVGIALAAAGLFAAVLWICTAGGASP